MFRFSAVEGGLLFMPVLDVACSRRCCIKSVKKFNDRVNSKLNCISKPWCYFKYFSSKLNRDASTDFDASCIECLMLNSGGDNVL
jgi:hypothetical protein